MRLEKSEDGNPLEYGLFIDGQQVDAEVDRARFVILSNTAVVEPLMSKPISEVTSGGLRLKSFPGMLKWWEAGKENSNIIINYDEMANSYTLSITLNTSPAGWRRLWTFSEYSRETKSLIRLEPYNDFIYQKANSGEVAAISDIFGLVIFIFYVDEQQTIGAEIARCSDLLQEVHKEAEKLLTAKLRTDSVVMYFDFPVEVRGACEQYLLYFVEFLRELGVEADAELKHDINGVLFAVTPTNAADALDKIRLALEVFLKLPSGSINDSSIMSEAIEIQRLSANIHHLQGQLSLAAALMKAKDATIEAQQITIQQQRLLLNGEVVLDSMKAINTSVKEANREEVLKDILAVTEYKGKGLEINLPEIIRRLKRFFSDK